MKPVNFAINPSIKTKALYLEVLSLKPVNFAINPSIKTKVLHLEGLSPFWNWYFPIEFVNDGCVGKKSFLVLYFLSKRCNTLVVKNEVVR